MNTPSYILCRCRAGLNDCLNQLWEVTRIAKQLNREILFQMPLYKATKISDILTFSKYPVTVHVDDEAEKRLNSIDTVFPADYFPYLHTIEQSPPNPIRCSVQSIPRSTLLVHDATGGGRDGQYAFFHCTFTPSFLNAFYSRYTLPPLYYAIHIRNTDYSTDLEYAKHLIAQFVSTHTSKPIYLLTDNPETQEIITTQFGIRKTHTQFVLGHSNLHSAGVSNTNILLDAFFDLCIIALSSEFLPIPCKEGNLSGFACLAQNLQTQKRKMMALLKRPISKF